MPSFADFLSGLASLFVDAVVIVAVYKIFQIAGEMSEIKELLRDIRRNTGNTAAPDPAPHSAESLVRAVHAASYSEIIEDATRHSEPQR